MRFSQSRLEEVTDENLNFQECPECGYDDSDSSQGIAMHFAYNHEGSLKYLFRCEECGRLHFGSGQKNKFCSKYCEIHNRVGTFKHFDGEFLREEIEEKGKAAYEIAEKLGVDKTLIWKWISKYDIGDEYECPSCDRSFPSKQGVSKHHMDEHSESISASVYVCENCGEEFTSMKSENNHIAPRFCSQDCYGESISGENNPNKDTERKQKISNGLLDAYAKGRKEPGGRKPFVVKETGHKVDSSWEGEVDKILCGMDIEYEYNGHGEYKRYDMGDFTHAPDFVVPGEDTDVVIEVKGNIAMYHQPEKMNKIAEEMTERNDVKYIVYGDTPNIDCDIFVEYGNIDKLSEVLE